MHGQLNLLLNLWRVLDGWQNLLLRLDLRLQVLGLGRTLLRILSIPRILSINLLLILQRRRLHDGLRLSRLLNVYYSGFLRETAALGAGSAANYPQNDHNNPSSGDADS